MFNRVGPTGDTKLDRRASDKTHEEFALGLMDGPYNSLEEFPGQPKVLVRRKPRWQSGDVRNIDDCSENGINETFESKETYKPAGIDHHVSAIKQWEASLPGVKLHGFVADLWKISGKLALVSTSSWFSGAIILALGNLEGSAVALLELQLVSKVVLAFLWQCVHFCSIICSFPCSTIKMIITVWSLLTMLHKLGLLGPKLATPGGDKFPLPSQVYRLLGTKVYLTVSPREILVLPSRVDSICCEPKKSFRPRNWVKVTLLRSLANSVSLQDSCLVDLDACILCRSYCVNTGKWLLPRH